MLRVLFFLPFIFIICLLYHLLEILPPTLEPASTLKPRGIVFEPDGVVQLLATSEPERCRGKERLLQILLRAGKPDLSVKDCDSLPTWKEVTDLYGTLPVVYGLDTCEDYRRILKENSNATHQLAPDIRVAGLFNTGTNALETLFSLNVKEVSDINAYQIDGGKHVPPKQEWYSTFDKFLKRDFELPIVLIRDPFRWMQSMVRVMDCRLCR
jgi:hypothetical protein